DDAGNQPPQPANDTAVTEAAEDLLRLALAGDVAAFKLAAARWTGFGTGNNSDCAQPRRRLSDIRDSHGAGLVHYAARSGAPELLNYLVSELGLSATQPAVEFGDTPAHNAAAAGQLACLTWLLLEAGADPLARDAEGMNLLHVAAYSGHAAAVEWLLHQTPCSAADQSASGAVPAQFCRLNDDETLGLLQQRQINLLNTGSASVAFTAATTAINNQDDRLQHPVSISTNGYAITIRDQRHRCG
uniref:ANK_REP_REGION domain-containing protein n=1 Tax=Macrostomum lignano TaxID=282301 RepID=A0A1I8ITC1_9PLAT